jgi:hypothetical protein
MKLLILVLSIFISGQILAQPWISTTVDTFADLAKISPISSRPSVRVLGSTSANDGGGGLFVWKPASTAATNTTANGGPIAWPYGSSSGRWEKQIENKAILKDAVLTGSTLVPFGSGLTLESGLVAQTVVLLGDPFTASPNQATQKRYVDAKAPIIVDDMVGLRNIERSDTFRMLAVVLKDTGNDGAAGDWYWEPGSTATVTVVCVSNIAGGTGRWFKR